MKREDKLEVVQMMVKDIIPYHKNPRNNDNAVEAVANSIREFGFQQPIVVDENNVVIVGHTRLKAAKRLGMETVPVIKATELTKDQVNAYRLADNKTGELATWDFDLLDLELDNIDMDMEQFGFEQEIEDEYFEDQEEPPEIEFTEVLGEEHNYIVLYFDNDVDWLQAETLFDIEPKKNLSTRKDGKVTKSIERIEVGRVLNGAEALEKIRGHYEDID